MHLTSTHHRGGAGNLALILTPLTKIVHCILGPLTHSVADEVAVSALAAIEHLDLLREPERALVHAADSLLDLMLRRDLRQSYRKEIANRLNEIFAGQDAMNGTAAKPAPISTPFAAFMLIMALASSASSLP